IKCWKHFVVDFHIEFFKETHQCHFVHDLLQQHNASVSSDFFVGLETKKLLTVIRRLKPIELFGLKRGTVLEQPPFLMLFNCGL
ncbi:MAG: hypothetical protein QM530_01745, partial [Phycisphaerales bacterium]|nr:hypothetical protein [Phycisphaerales bacterium]